MLFNQYGTTQIAAGSTIWFSSVLESVRRDGRDVGSDRIRIDVRESRITFGSWPYVIAMPDSTIVLDASTREPQRSWARNSWSLSYAPSQLQEAFYDGMPFKAPEPFIPGQSGPVTWTAKFYASRPGVTVNWAWSAAVYSQFGTNAGLVVDPAGTPERFKQYVIAGAMGDGAPQYSGSRSESASVTACQSSEPPPSTPPQAENGLRVSLVRPPFPVRPSFPRMPETASFASDVSQRATLADGSVVQVVDRCYTTDLCAAISFGNGDRLSIYSEGAARCRPYVLYFSRAEGFRTIYGFSRSLDYDRSAANASRCGRYRTTHIALDGGRINLTISKNADGTLGFHFDKP